MSEDLRDWDLEYDGAAPPLPREMERRLRSTPFSQNWWRGWLPWQWKRKRGEARYAQMLQRQLPSGAYFAWFEPRIAWVGDVKLPNLLAGVLRIHHEVRNQKLYSSGSGDLYVVSTEEVQGICRALGSTHDENERLKALQFPIAMYRYYLRLETLWVVYREATPPNSLDVSAKERVILGFDTRRYSDMSVGWEKSQPISFQLSIDDKDLGRFRGHPCCYPGYTVANSFGNEIGAVRLVKAADMLRHAEVEVRAIHRSSASRLIKPIEQASWSKVLNKAGWAVKIVDGPDSYDQDGSEYSVQKLRNILNETANKDGACNSSETASHCDKWKYWLFIVEKILNGEESTPLGIMPDYGDDPPGEPARQGAAVAAKGKIDYAEAEELQDHAPLYYRTAFHEVGHMQGLYHNPSTRGIMQPRKYMATNDLNPEIDSSHSAIDAMRLRHLPDLWVRPGGLPFLYRYRASPVEVLDLLPPTRGLSLEVALPTVLSGVPSEGEIEVELRNQSGEAIKFPVPDDEGVEMAYWQVNVETPSGQRLRGGGFFVPESISQYSGALYNLESFTYSLKISQFLPVIYEMGTNLLHVHLIWAYSYPASTGRGRVTYRADGSGSLNVAAGPRQMRRGISPGRILGALRSCWNGKGDR
jgi:hypothetical protein